VKFVHIKPKFRSYSLTTVSNDSRRSLYGLLRYKADKKPTENK